MEKNSRSSPIPTPNSKPRLNPAAIRAPIPANAIWLRDNCPAQPVTMVIETAQIAKARMLAYNRWREGRSTMAGIIRAMPSRTASEIVDRCLTHQNCRRRSGMGRLRAEKENDESTSRLPRLWKATATATTTNNTKSIRPPWLKNTNCTWAWTTPMRIPAPRARGKETMPAMTAAARARAMVLGPRF